MSEPNPAERTGPSATPRPEPAGIRAAAGHAADAEFSAFYRATMRVLVNFLLYQRAPLAVATDIAQDTMIKAYRRWSDITYPRTWVHTVASRALVRHVAETYEDLVDQLPEPSALLAQPQDATAWESRQILLQVMRRLPPRQAQVLAWTFSDFTPAEIAEQLGMTPNAVSASLKKARRAAVKHLSAIGYLTTGEEA
jgi:RNA polymerase sigma-70 factor (ECF subfamily)